MSFNADLPTNRDKVRLKIGDYTPQDEELVDDTYDALLVVNSDDVLLSARDAAKAILAKFARVPDQSGVGMSASLSQKVANYKEVLAQINEELSGSGGVYLAGVSFAERQALRSDPDYVQPRISVGMDDNPASSENIDPHEPR